MSGTKTRSRALKTAKSRILNLLSLFMAACLLFLGAGLPAFADETTEAFVPFPLDANLMPITISLGSSATAGHLTPYQLIDDYGIIYNLDQENDVYSLSISPSNEYVTVVFKGLITTRLTFTGFPSNQLQSPFFGATNIGVRITVNNLNIASTIERCSVENIEVTSNYDYHGAQNLYNVTSSAFTIQDSGTMFSEYIYTNPIIKYQFLVFASYRVPCTNNDFNSVLSNIMTQTVTVSAQEQTSSNTIFNGWMGEYNDLEMLNYIQTQLFEIYKYDQGIFSELASVLTKLQNIDNRFVSLLSNLAQYHLEDQAWQNRLYNLLNDYLNHTEAPEVSSNLESIQESIESQAAVADSAVEEAIPSAESELAVLESYSGVVDLQTTHATAINFWKQVGEYILDPVNMGAAASVLIAASVLAFIVFLLRL